jgi:hypothetical protein
VETWQCRRADIFAAAGAAFRDAARQGELTQFSGAIKQEMHLKVDI